MLGEICQILFVIEERSCGIPQGSILGTLLFIIHINDLPGVVKNDLVMFADDSCINYSRNKWSSQKLRSRDILWYGFFFHK